MSQYRFSIDIPVENRWDNVERVRGAVERCFEAVFQDVAGRDAVAMVTGELLENAIKYGDWTGGHGFFRLRVWGDDTHSVVVVTNPVAPGSDGPARVAETIGFIEAQRSPLEAYQARLLQLAGGARGGLGLVRVAYEGACQLAVGVLEGHITVTAERHHLGAGTRVEVAPIA
jgi:hypothetical protein